MPAKNKISEKVGEYDVLLGQPDLQVSTRTQIYRIIRRSGGKALRATNHNLWPGQDFSVRGLCVVTFKRRQIVAATLSVSADPKGKEDFAVIKAAYINRPNQ